MGSRDRVVGECNNVRPMERQAQHQNIEDMSEEQIAEIETGSGREAPAEASAPQNRIKTSSGLQDAKEGAVLPQGSTSQELDHVVNDELVDINRYRYSDAFNSSIWSTCPIIPKYHSTFGEPVDRQEQTTENEINKDADPKKGQA